MRPAALLGRGAAPVALDWDGCVQAARVDAGGRRALHAAHARPDAHRYKESASSPLGTRKSRAFRRRGPDCPRAAAITTYAELVAQRLEIEYEPGRIISLETGEIGRQAAGAVFGQENDTVVYATACAGPAVGDGSFVPFQVHYHERMSAMGKTATGYNKRDGRPRDSEVLKARLIDRPLRPMFQEGWPYDTQVLSWVLSYDGQTSPEPLAITCSAAALLVSDIPFQKAVAGVRVGMVDGEFVVNPTVEQMKSSTLDLVMAGTEDAVLMIEGFADFLSEDQMLAAVERGHKVVATICGAMQQWAATVGKAPREDGYALPDGLEDRVREMVAEEVQETYLGQNTKSQRATVLAAALGRCVEELADGGGLEVVPTEVDVAIAFKRVESQVMRGLVLQRGYRADGRAADEIRPITTRCGLLPRAHGSALFTRGETQALAVTTLGSERDGLSASGLADEEEVSRFYLQYFFPPSSVGEVGRVGGPGRRELGHGVLAERALAPAVPDLDSFPYTVRVESTITESNGSSSMASVCGGCLALMDAGVPIREPVAGIAMGLVLDPSGKFVVLSDILGSEDALGDMDFKVAGGMVGVTAFQMDIKVEGITLEIMRVALERARVGRKHILGEMLKSKRGPRGALSPFAPRMARLVIPKEKIGALIGPQGKVVRAIQAAMGATVTVDSDSGSVDILTPNEGSLARTREVIQAIVAEPEKGKLYRGCVVTGLAAFGAFVEILPGKTGLVHISELDVNGVKEVSDAVKEGDVVDVMLLDTMDNGKMKLSRRAAQIFQKDSPGDRSRDVDAAGMIQAALQVPGAFQLGAWLVTNGYPSSEPGAEKAQSG